MLACRIKQQLEPPGFRLVYRERTRLPATPLTQARRDAESPRSPHSPGRPNRTGLDSLMHGATTSRVGLTMTRAALASLPASPHGDAQ